MRIRPREVVNHALATSGMAHEDDFARAKCRRLVVFDVVQTLGNLIRVSIEVTQPPGLVGGGKRQCEERPFSWLESTGKICHVGCGSEAIAQSADEKETVRFANCWLGVFECHEGFCLRFVLEGNGSHEDRLIAYIVMEDTRQTALGPEFGVHCEYLTMKPDAPGRSRKTKSFSLTKMQKKFSLELT